MYRKPVIVFLLLLCSFAIAHAQYTEIFGKVTDAYTKEPIPYVNVHFVGSVKAVQTDPKGEYVIRTIEKVDSISFSYIGFQTRVIAVKRGRTEKLNVELGSQELKLTEITVKAGHKRQKRVIDTTANYVYYKVLENKERNRSNAIPSYKYDNYEKLLYSLLNPTQKFINFPLWRAFHFGFENTDTTPAGNVYIPGIMQETESEVYYRKEPHATRKIVKADVMTGVDNPSIGDLAKYQFRETDIYDNLFVIAYNSFVAPFSPNGIRTYYYYLTDTQKIDGRISYKLHFVGKVKEDLALKGYAWIDSATWAVRYVTFRPNEHANLNFINNHTVIQEFTRVQDKYWIMSHETINAVGSLFKKDGKMSILVKKVLDRRNIQVDIAIPDTVFKGGDEIIMLDSARNRPRAYWDSTRFEKLTPQEVRVYEISDTIKTVKAWKTFEWLGRFFTAAFADAGPISFGRVLNFASKNNVEGWRLRCGFETNPRFQHIGTPANNFLRTFYFYGYVAYGLKDRVWQYQALSRINLPRKNNRWQSLEFLYRFDMRVPGQDEEQNLLTFDNIVTLISGKTLTKIMRVREFRVSYEKEWLRGFSNIFTMNEKTYYDIPGIFNFNRRVGDAIVRIPNFNVSEFILDTRYAYRDQYIIGTFYRYFQPTRYPVLMLRYTAGVVDMQGDYFNYHNLLLTVKQRLSWAAGHTNYIFRAGKIFGRAPYMACYLTQGNMGVLLDKFNYNLLGEFEFVSDQYASLWVEHHFDGLLFNKIPGINKLKLRELVFVKSLVGSFSKKNADVMMPLPEISAPGPVPYIECGVGIENILYMFRVDFLFRATYRNKPGGQNWGVKFAFQPGF